MAGRLLNGDIRGEGLLRCTRWRRLALGPGREPRRWIQAIKPAGVLGRQHEGAILVDVDHAQAQRHLLVHLDSEERNVRGGRRNPWPLWWVDVLAICLGEEEAELIEHKDGRDQPRRERATPQQPPSLEGAAEGALAAQVGAIAHGQRRHHQDGGNHR